MSWQDPISLGNNRRRSENFRGATCKPDVLRGRERRKKLVAIESRQKRLSGDRMSHAERSCTPWLGLRL